MKNKLYLYGAIIGLIICFTAMVNTLNHNSKLRKNLSQLNNKYEALLNAPKDTIRLTEIDTITEVKPVYITQRIVERDSIVVRDTIKDIEIVVPREEKVYKSDDYRAVVSGYQPRLDSIQVYKTTITEVVTKHIEHTKYKRFGIGVGVGAGYDGKRVRPIVYGGVQYNLLSF